MSLPARTVGIRSLSAWRLRRVGWAILQTALAAGLAWYLTHDVLGHREPFFAPIAAAVCLWATNVVRAELAIEMMIGVGLGIGVGTGVLAVLGTGPISMGVAVVISLFLAVLIAQSFSGERPMFVNQTVISAILVLAFPHTGLGLERLFDALIGGGLAVLFSILIFPKNPSTVLRDARNGVLTALHGVLAQIDLGTEDLTTAWTLTAADRLHRQLARLIQARATAIQLAQACPRRWPLREATRAADRQAAQLALLASSVLQLARAVTTASSTGFLLVEPLRAAITDLTEAGAALTDEPPVAAAHAASARRHTAALGFKTDTATDALLAAAIDTCADELQQVVDVGAH